MVPHAYYGTLFHVVWCLLRYHVSYGVVSHAYTGAQEAVAAVATGSAPAVAVQAEAVAAPAGNSAAGTTAATALGGPEEPPHVVYDGLTPLFTHRQSQQYQYRWRWGGKGGGPASMSGPLLNKLQSQQYQYY